MFGKKKKAPEKNEALAGGEPPTRKTVEREMDAAQAHWENNVSLFRLYSLASRINWTLLVYSAVLTLALVWVETHPPLPTYFATSKTGRIIPLVPLDRPYVTDHTVIAWAMQKIPDALSFSALNYRRDLQRARAYFTENGYQGFLAGLKNHGELKAIRDRNLMVSTIPTGPGVVVWQGHLPNGIFAWKVQFPVKMIFRSSSEINEHAYDATVLIQRAVTLKNPAAISIQTFYLGATK
ncbi:DotI/IcmL/TraM family protein [Acidithiobacillus thiooxidans]|uniref:DotI/IcmL/TraM family protein n=1 Tax=Acidithiobacillus thiooxidans TaxID=930 RepID=UPI0028629025|nr:DotI/IcmL/TraM family protein [Acidithiobacillus thiooxidans]MDR7926397.1 DotI/IcmL/TraM family protein [Acidithiobacillus thiooxidans]